MSRQTTSKKADEGEKSTSKGNMMCLCCGGEYYIPFLRQYWHVPSRHSGELNATADEDDDCVIVYEQTNKQDNTRKRSLQDEETNGKPEETDDNDDCIIVYETISEQKKRKNDDSTLVSETTGVGMDNKQGGYTVVCESADELKMDKDDGCTAVHETIGGQEMNKRDDCTVVRKTIGGRKTNKRVDCTVVRKTIGERKTNKHDDFTVVCGTIGEREMNKHHDCTVVRETIDGQKTKNGNDCTVACETTGGQKNMRDQSVQTFEIKQGNEQEKNLQEGEEYFTQGQEPESIIRAMSSAGKTKFLVKLKNASRKIWVPKEIIDAKYPEIAFNFYTDNQ